jgi:acyl-CoA thioesterase
MTPLSTLFAALTPIDDGFGVTITEDWQQGRTTYGGLTAALCVQAALRAEPGLPPLRSAQFAFVGPAGGAVRMAPKTLRRGKNTVFMAVDLSGEAGLATRATLVFGAPRASTLAYTDLAAPRCTGPSESPAFFGEFTGPTFARHFDYLRAGGQAPRSGAVTPEYCLWLRHRDTSLGGNVPALIAIADAPPPAAMAMFTTTAPISTVTWSMDLFDVPEEEGSPWRLMTCRAERIAEGYSTQEMMLWSQSGAPLMLARQNIAVFV